jgi:ubiquinone/menaquinone biosynthesis C-methylase UbiE
MPLIPRPRWLRPGVRRIAAVATVATAALAGLLLYSGQGERVLALARGDDWSSEADRLVRVLGLEPGMTVADVGAGRGELAIEMARRLGPSGHVYATEIDPARLEDIRRAVRDAGLDTVTVVTAGARESHLPEACCNAIYLREVYHHLSDPAVTTMTLHRALKPGGLLAVIDYPERGSSGGNCHCIDKQEVIRQVAAAGFEHVSDEDRWSGSRYLVVFRKR